MGINIPDWLTKSLKIPVLRYFIGAIAVLLLLVVVFFRAMLLYKRRLKVSRDITRVQTTYVRKKAEQQRAEDNTVKVSKRVKNAKIKKLKKKQADINKAAQEGSQAVADLLNQAFGKQK
mgnify:CR=1 FL=1